MTDLTPSQHPDPLAHEELHADVGSAPPVKPMSGRTLATIAVSAAVVLILLLVVTLLPRRAVDHELLAEAAAHDSAPMVQVTIVHRAAPGSTLSLPSTVQPLHESAIYARVGGYVKRWYADIGTVVHAGQLLVDIDALISAGGSTAPAAAGGAAGATSAGSLYRIAQTDTVRTYLTVPEAYATSIQPGLKATVSAQGLPGRLFTGTVTRTAHALDVASRTLLTEVDVPNRDFALLPGMYATAQLTFPRVTPPLLLPANTILVRAGGVQVVTVSPSPDGHTALVHFKHIQVVRDYGANVEVSGDVTDGMTVVTNPGAELVDGAKVRIQPASPGRGTK